MDVLYVLRNAKHHLNQKFLVTLNKTIILNNKYMAEQIQSCVGGRGEVQAVLWIRTDLNLNMLIHLDTQVGTLFGSETLIVNYCMQCCESSQLDKIVPKIGTVP